MPKLEILKKHIESLLDEFGIDGNFMIRGFISWPITNVLSNGTSLQKSVLII